MTVEANPRALTPEVEDFRRQFETLSADADALVAPLSDEQFSWKPAPEAWSVAECLEHLNVTARLYLPALDDGIADAIRRGIYGEGPFVYGLVGRLAVRSMEPSPRFRVKAPKAFRPAAPGARHEVMAAFRAYQLQYTDRLRQAHGLDLARARIASPVVRWIRLPLGCGFAMMTAHERRHLAQARRVTGTAGFPR
jgi:hypothetical protein